MALIYRFLELFCTLALLLFTCELAGGASNRFDAINNLIDQFDWYLFPLQMKKLLPTIMMNSQQIFGFKYFGSFLCNRETFRRVNVTRIILMAKVIDTSLFFRWPIVGSPILWYFVDLGKF